MREPSSDEDPRDRVRVERLRPVEVIVLGGEGVDELDDSCEVDNDRICLELF